MRQAYWPLAVCACVAAISLAAGDAHGATGLAFLKNGVDARASILGQAMTSVADDASACYWNPAGLGRRAQPQLLLSHVESFADLRQEFGAAVQPAGPVVFGLFFNGIWAEDTEGYDLAGNETGSFGYSGFAAGVAAGAETPWGVTLGVAGKYLREDIGVYNATGWALDGGAQWRPSPSLPLRLGLALQNLGPSMKFIAEEFDLPLTIQGGASWEFHPIGASSRLLVAGDLRNVRGQGTGFLLGAEYGYQNLLSFGAGYQTAEDVRDVSFGIGANVGRLQLHWAYAPISEDLGDEQRLSLRIDL